MKTEEITISNVNIDESVLSRPHYKLADFTVKNKACAINVNNNIAYPIVGKRFSQEMKNKHPHFSDTRCMINMALSPQEL